MESFPKQPAEAYTIAMDYTNKLPTGATVSSGTVAAVDLVDNSSASSTVLASTTATISGAQARVKVQAGTNGRSYIVTFTTTLSNGDILEDDVRMDVKSRP